MQLGLVIVMVIGIHMIEAYGLNPAIYSAHLKLHPLLVLTVLVVAEHSLGVWGLLLAGAPLPGCKQGCFKEWVARLRLLCQTRRCMLLAMAPHQRADRVAVAEKACCAAVPLTVFTLDYCIRYPACSVTDVAARELATVSIADYDGAEFGDFRAGFGEPEHVEA